MYYGFDIGGTKIAFPEIAAYKGSQSHFIKIDAEDIAVFRNRLWQRIVYGIAQLYTEDKGPQSVKHSIRT